MADKSYRVRLSTDVLPEVYHLRLEPDLERHVFKGNVRIECNVAVATDIVTVNTKQLLISGAKFKPEGGEELQANGIHTKIKEMTTAFEFEEVLPVGKGVLEIDFQGTLNDQMAGFYRSKYKNSKGEEKFMGVTQFEAIDARRAFPCWDEPGVKAVFVVTMVFPSCCMSLSNMPASKSETLPDGRISETYMPTPKMSTYLLAFCVGEYESIGGQTKGGTLARVFCTPGNLAKCDFALKCTIGALDFYNEFFGIRYPLPKVDMIAIPDFSAGAMENWGLITYREAALLCDEKTVSVALKKRICTVIAHELAHQWFGNLVTMEWWDDLWLNEGFANWMQNFCSDKLFPEWNLWESYVAEDQQMALRLDGMRSSHPIQVPIGKAETVEEVFDAISYCKGGSVVRMIYSVLGEKDFQAGLKLYFQKHQYGNTETTDLWQAWTEASGKPISKMMGSWTIQMGYPVLKVLTDPVDSGSDEIEVEQCWFLADGSEKPGDADKKWFVPVNVGSNIKKASETVFVEEQAKAKISLGGTAKGASWLKLNLGQHVPCRVLYPPSLLAKLASKVMELPVEDKIGLLSDSYALCKNGSGDAVSLCKLLGSFKDDVNDKVWTQLSACLGGLRKVMAGLPDEAPDAFQKFAGRLVYPGFKAAGWDPQDGDDDNRKKFRSTMVGLIKDYFDSATMSDVGEEAQKRCHAFLESPCDATLNPDIRAAVLSIAMEVDGSQKLYDKLVAVHNETNDNPMKKDIYAALAAAKSKEMSNRFLEWGLTEDVRSQDLIYVPMNIVGKKGGGDLVFNWVHDHYDKIYKRLGESSMMLFMHIVKLSGAGFVTEEKATEVKDFWRSQKIINKVEKALDQTVEGIQTEAKFVARLKGTELEKASFWMELAGKL